MEKSLRTVVSIVLMLVIFSPLARALGNIESFDFGNVSDIFGEAEDEEGVNKFIESFDRYGADYVNAEIRADVCDTFGIEENNCRALASFEMRDGALCPKKITVILSGKAIWRDPHEIEDYVEEKYGCECAVAVE